MSSDGIARNVVRPRRSWRDPGRLRSDRRDPILNGFGDELGPIVGTYIPWHTVQDEENGQDIDHIDRSEPPIDPDRQAFMGVLADDLEHPVFLCLVGEVLDKKS